MPTALSAMEFSSCRVRKFEFQHFRYDRHRQRLGRDICLPLSVGGPFLFRNSAGTITNVESTRNAYGVAANAHGGGQATVFVNGVNASLNSVDGFYNEAFLNLRRSMAIGNAKYGVETNPLTKPIRTATMFSTAMESAIRVILTHCFRNITITRAGLDKGKTVRRNRRTISRRLAGSRRFPSWELWFQNNVWTTHRTRFRRPVCIDLSAVSISQESACPFCKGPADFASAAFRDA